MISKLILILMVSIFLIPKLSYAVTTVIGIGGLQSVMMNGSGAGNYTTTSTTDVNVDSLNLCYALQTTVNKNIIILATGIASNSAVNVLDYFSIYKDSVKIVKSATFIQAWAASGWQTFNIITTTLGDGNIHNFCLRWAAQSNTALMYNTNTGSILGVPVMTIFY